MNTIRLLLLLGAAGMATASLVHREILLPGNPDAAAATAEAILAGVLLLGLAIGWLWPRWARPAAAAAFTIALVGDLVGFSIYVVVDPDKVLDIAAHVVLALILASGLALTLRRDSVTA